jgi:hypothetical protein
VDSQGVLRDQNAKFSRVGELAERYGGPEQRGELPVGSGPATSSNSAVTNRLRLPSRWVFAASAACTVAGAIVGLVR